MEIAPLEITQEDRKKYSANVKVETSLSVIEERSDKSLEISKPLDLPRLPTIGDMRVEGKLTKADEESIKRLAYTFRSTNGAKISLDNVTPEEAQELIKYSEVTANMTRQQIWQIIRPYFKAVFGVQLYDKYPKMRTIEKKSDADPVNYAPTMEWLVIIAQNIIHSRKDLFKFNIDFGAKMFDHKERPIDFLLMLIKAQRQMYPKRNPKLTDAFFTKALLLIQSHTELLLKLKVKDQKGDDFYGSKYPKIRDSLKIMKGIMYVSYSGKPLTIKQQSLLISIFDDYKKTLDMIFIVDPDAKTLYDEPFTSRKKKDVKMAALEAYHMFDDSSTSSFGLSIKNATTDVSACQLLNSIFFNIEKGESMKLIYRNGIAIQHLEEYIKQYFALGKSEDRWIIREKVLSTAATDGHKKIIKSFFDVLDKYIK